MKIPMALTSHDQLGNAGRKTAFWLEEFAAPYFVFRDAGIELTLASPKGGQPPPDPKSDVPENQTPAMAWFKQDPAAQKALSQTVRLADMKSEDYDTVFYVGGHGPMWDLAESPVSIALLESFYNSGKPIALVCHSPGVLGHHVTYQGAPLVKGKHVTGFTNGEEEEMHLTSEITLGCDMSFASRDKAILSLGRSAAQDGIKALMARGFHKPGDVENRLGYDLGQIAP
jgi:putative intracellular protease/amidase